VDITTVVTAIGGVGLAAGSFYSGRKTLKTNDSQLAVNTVDLLNAQLGILRTENAALKEILAQQGDRIKILEALVTQRAEVEMVKDTVLRIEAKLNAQA
jgi:putative ubiquitin-RnfH superfamily antitoxin RatB of RatAB toxin-antitoxin module